MYNVLEKLRSGEPLTAKEKQIHDQGLVTMLKQIHDELDDAVMTAYGWYPDLKGPWPLADRMSEKNAHAEVIQQELLRRLVALNHERAAEEKRGLIRWLRPSYQNPKASTSGGHRPPLQTTLADTDPVSSQSKIKNQQSSINPSFSAIWPARLPDQVAILRKLIAGEESVAPPDAGFNRNG